MQLIEPAGRPFIQCRKCRVAVVWPTDLPESLATTFASVARRNLLDGVHFAEEKLGLGPREAKVLALHVTRSPGVCHRCQRSVQHGESVCECKSANIDW